MSKKDYEKAARIAQGSPTTHREAITIAFTLLFTDDNPAFDEARFRAACVPGVKVTARPKHAPETTHADWHGLDCKCEKVSK